MSVKKRSIIPEDVKTSLADNLKSFDDNENTSVENSTTLISKIPEQNMKEEIEQLKAKIDAMSVTNTQTKKRVEPRSADRGPIMNVHVPKNIKKKIIDIKDARWQLGERVTTDTIIYECIIDWLNRNYDKMMARINMYESEGNLTIKLP